ncbi:hypothetical protein EYE40_05625 [Glaciihabitans arcticus]|uniref:Uncharacterized protein n=1 Tax=Glaciihabitans arcticus TaxID=2668039 RepID=A0A4Q9GQG4_9MICO|nr:hypothetical protein [Glaciihabitans arcticus]TBN56921.1 hypothetical protein EYE40_05625 [Glaciihabitans arcticus]
MKRSRDLDDASLDGLIRTTDPAARFKIDRERLSRIAATVPRRRRSRLAVWIALAAAATLGLAAAAPAIADGIQRLARTGDYGPVTTESDGSEWISAEGDDFSEYASTLYPDWIPLPEGISDELFRGAMISQLAEVEGVSQASSIQHSFEHGARCTWVDEWLNADARDDTARADAAAEVLRAAVSWPAGVALDGGGYVDHLADVATAANQGDREVLEYERESDCGSSPKELRR